MRINVKTTDFPVTNSRHPSVRSLMAMSWLRGFFMEIYKMGLGTTHDCWHGSYGNFSKWRKRIAELAGLPPLDLMAGFFTDDEYGPFSMIVTGGTNQQKNQLTRVTKLLPIKWECLEDRPLLLLLSHSDCDGEIEHADCKPIADDLKTILSLFNEDKNPEDKYWKPRTEKFIAGLLDAHAKQEKIEFH